MNKKENLDKLVVFKDKAIRRILHENAWWFSVVDVVAVLTESLDPGGLLEKIKTKVK